MLFRAWSSDADPSRPHNVSAFLGFSCLIIWLPIQRTFNLLKVRPSKFMVIRSLTVTRAHRRYCSMFGYRCLGCRSTLRQATSYFSTARVTSIHTKTLNRDSRAAVDIDSLLSKDNATWSVTSLLPQGNTHRDLPIISRTQLHHLLRLSALPMPKDEAEENMMIETLRSQLHFVKDIQSVETSGVEPLQAIRDETTAAIRERTIGVETLSQSLDNEEIKGRNKRPRRKRDSSVQPEGVDWDALGHAERKVGQYFVVNSGKAIRDAGS